MNGILSLLALSLTTLPLFAQPSQRLNHKIYSTALSEYRQIDVQLPKDYSNEVFAYNVLYVLDGEYAFEYAAGTVTFLSNPFGYIPPHIVVGIPNIDRTRDMTMRFDPADSYKNFLEFIESELIPFVDSTYRTTGFDLLYGWSSASNINMQFLAKTPHLFDAHIQSGTGIGTKTTEFFSEYLAKNVYDKKFLYANVEGSGPRVNGLNNYKSLIESINPRGLKWKFEIMDSSSHVNVLAEGIYNGLQFVYKDFYLPDDIVLKGLDSILSYYQRLEDVYEYDVQIPIGVFIESAGLLFQDQKPEEAIRLLLHGMDQYPDSHDLAGSLAEIYEYLNDVGQAAKYYELAHDRSPEQTAAKLQYLHLSQKMKAYIKKSQKD